MNPIHETPNFLVEAAPAPLVSREEGGHVVITPRVRLNDRTLLSPPLAIELMYLTMLVGEAMTIGLNNRGIDVGRINYQDNGNWGVFTGEGPYLHVHLYGRAISAKVQKYGESCQFPFRDTGFYDAFQPLDEQDAAEIKAQMDRLGTTARYDRAAWHW